MMVNAPASPPAAAAADKASTDAVPATAALEGSVAAAEGRATGGQPTALVALVHRAEVSWDQDINIFEVLKVGVMHQYAALHWQLTAAVYAAPAACSHSNSRTRALRSAARAPLPCACPCLWPPAHCLHLARFCRLGSV
jgi:hypothetical protein